MPNNCCVPDCNGNYANSEKVRVFRFYKDATLRKKWLAAISRENFIPGVSSRVCEHHFEASDFISEISQQDQCDCFTKIMFAPSKRKLGRYQVNFQTAQNTCQKPSFTEKVKMKHVKNMLKFVFNKPYKKVKRNI